MSRLHVTGNIHMPIVDKKFRIICSLVLCIAVFLTNTTPFSVLAQAIKQDMTLRLFPDMYFQEVIPGQDNILYLEVANNSNEPITNIILYAKVPEQWTVEFQPRQIDELSRGSAQTINVNIRPAGNADNDEYNVTLVAEANETQRMVSTILRVENATSEWLRVGVVLAGLMVAGFVVIYRRFGRQ